MKGKEKNNRLSRRLTIIALDNQFYRFYIDEPIKNKKDLKFLSNEVDTRKYNCITFLPKALLLQFDRPANIYFLVCAILQCIPVISPLGPATAILPLIIVLSASLIREGMEDFSRGRLDKQQNMELCERYNREQNRWDKTQSGSLYVGDIISINEDDTFPADIILIDSNLPEGICYIETGTLDGEKTLKLKQAQIQTVGMCSKSGEKVADFNLSGNVVADFPNPVLYKLNGKMHMKFNRNNDNEQIVLDIPLDSKQLLLKGAKLRNTKWVVGIVVYSGLNCKIMKNSKEPRNKYSSVEKLMNLSLLYIFIFQIILCIISAFLRGAYYKKNKLNKADRDPTNFGYTEFGDSSYGYEIESFFNFFTYLLLINTMIPISLIITMEVVKMFQGYFMGYDKYSYSKLRKKFLKPNSVSLNEECGMVNYIFSDKTGTLTSNKMEFKYCVIGETCYQYIRNENNEGDEKEQNFRKEENIIPFHKYEMLQSVKNKDSKFNHKLNSPYIMSSENNQKIKLVLENNNLLIEQFWFALSLCHTCSVEIKEDGIEEYSCISPDSIELVKAARDQGWKFTKSEASSIKRINFGMTEGKIIDFERLELIEFSSDRKRETIIVKEKNGADDIIKLYCKGADSIIEKRLSQNTPQNILAQCKYYVNKFSSLGFRTLFIAMKILSQEEYDTFSNLLKEAQMSLEDKDKKVAEVYDTIEKNLFLLGATIVEDKLQDLVPETIRDLRLAKIKIWVLTGDKMNTAYNIGLSCNLISKKMKIFNICGKEEKKDSNYKDINKDEREKVIFDFAKEFQGYKGQFNSLEKPSFGILIDEKALLTVSEGEDVKKIFLDIAKDAEAVICCRVSPLQKSQVVKMMKEYDNNAITLAIGDGGNDVPMIMESHIGVGIYGEEGLRAVQSSDYAIGEFKILRELLFTHGRMNYVKNAECIHYFFYKNFILTFNQFIYGFYCNFTGQTILDDWFITLYNLLFTSLPLGTKAILDKDLCRDDGIIVYKLLPFIYKENRDNPVFTIYKFLLNLLKGLLFSLINCFIVIYSLHNIHFNKKGFMPGLWFMSADLYTNILIIVTSTLLITTRYHTWIHFAILGVVTVISYIVFLIMVQNLSIFNSVGTMGQAFQSSTMWFNIILISGTCGLIDFFILSFNYYFNPDIISTLQRIYSQKGEKINTKEGLPKYILDKIDIYDNIENKIEEKNIEVKDVPTKNEEKKSKNTQEEDENSKDILIHNHKTEIINDLKAEKNSKNLQIETIPEDFNSYFNDDFSEKISQEKNLDFHEEKYFVEPWNFNQKIAKNH